MNSHFLSLNPLSDSKYYKKLYLVYKNNEYVRQNSFIYATLLPSINNSMNHNLGIIDYRNMYL